jgi:hypothetical protein
MRIRFFFSLLLSLAVLGCGTGFKDEAEELEYLSSLSNPTPAQFLRKKELMREQAKQFSEPRAQLERPADAPPLF